MKNLSLNDVVEYVEEHIGTFHTQRLQNLSNLQLSKVIKRKNPYLFKAKNFQTAYDIVKGLVDAYLSSNEETIFGDWLEGLAIFINSKEFGGRKSGIASIDLEFDLNGIRYIVNIKSGPNWGNSSQIKKMKADFLTAKRTLRTSQSGLKIIAVNGCCYGRDNRPDKGDYYKYCGQAFWTFISGDDMLYKDIIEPLGHQAKQHNEAFEKSYSQMLNKFTLEFTKSFCKENGEIDWLRLAEFNSAR
jgi:hypothetical protein